MPFSLMSSAFEHGASIPALYTCDGAETAPPLSWSGAPEGTRSYAIIMDDPDAPDPTAPKRVWVHWVLYNIPANVRSLSEGLTAADLPAGAREGMNDSGTSGYSSPCPPRGEHRYFFRIFALDAELADLGRTTRARLEEAMKGHVKATAELMGRYRRTRV